MDAESDGILPVNLIVDISRNLSHSKDRVEDCERALLNPF